MNTFYSPCYYLSPAVELIELSLETKKLYASEEPWPSAFFLISQNFVAPLGTLKGRKSKNQKTTFSLIDTMRNILDFHQNRLTPRPISGTGYPK